MISFSYFFFWIFKVVCIGIWICKQVSNICCGFTLNLCRCSLSSVSFGSSYVNHKMMSFALFNVFQYCLHRYGKLQTGIKYLFLCKINLCPCTLSWTITKISNQSYSLSYVARKMMSFEFSNFCQAQFSPSSTSALLTGVS